MDYTFSGEERLEGSAPLVPKERNIKFHRHPNLITEHVSSCGVYTVKTTMEHNDSISFQCQVESSIIPIIIRGRVSEADLPFLALSGQAEWMDKALLFKQPQAHARFLTPPAPSHADHHLVCSGKE